jgi:SSS family transporter
LARLSALDLAVFIAYMMLLVSVGLYFSRQKKSLKSYLLADQNVHWMIVAISVLAALFSGVTYLGAPAESFFFDLTYLWVIVSFFIATPITTLVFLPFFRNLSLYTAYEYLERRFDRRLRWLASGLFITRVSCYLGLAIAAPALAIVEITGWEFWLAVLVTGLAATLYTALGGMKAVIWTDSLQFLVLCGGILLILGYAAAEVPGGFLEAWRLAAADGKTRLIHLELDPTVRLTVWGALLGGACNNLVQMVTDQIAVQRYLTAKSLRECQRALWFKLWVTLPLVGLFYLTGTVLYGYYRATPDRAPKMANATAVPYLAQPETTAPNEGIRNDRILPYFVVQHLPPPLPGLLIAAVFGATMAVVSAGINSLATATLMDFAVLLGPQGTERFLFRQARLLTCFFGILSTGLALVVSRLGTLVESTITIMGLFGGPLLGMFFLGVLSRRANSPGALLGALAGSVGGAAVAFSKYLFNYEISFIWIAFCATVTTFGLGWLFSLLFAPPVSATAGLVIWNNRENNEPTVSLLEVRAGSLHDNGKRIENK